MTRFTLLLVCLHLWSLTLSAQKPDLFILSVGVEQYKDARLNLNFCADDARDLAAALSKQNLLYNIHTPKVLTDAQASRAAVRTALSELEREVTTDDLFVFVFSGHGIEDRLVTYDFNMSDAEASSLSKTDLLQRINKLGCGYLLYIDACHSGSFAKSLPGKDILQADAGLNSRALVDALAGSDKPYLIFGSSGSDQKSWECSSCGHGYFAQTLLDALQNKVVTNGTRRFTPDADGDGYISPYELDYYIKEAVRVNTAQEETPQKVYSRLTMGANFPLYSVPGARAPTGGTQPPTQPPVRIPDTQPTTTTGSSPATADERRSDLEAYQKAKDANTIEAYQEYLSQRRNGLFAETARKALNALIEARDAQRRDADDDLDWTIAHTADTESAYQQYLNTWPKGRHLKEANAAIAALSAPELVTDPMAGTFVLVKGGNVKLSDRYNASLSSFYMGQTEVTQAEWRAVMGTSPSSSKNCDECPVENVSWNDIQDFLSKLNSRSGGARYRLPTEAEWEYAARGGPMSRGYEYAGSNDVDEVAWYTSNSGGNTKPVKGKASNELGLYDMSGNVWEWCSDWYGDYPSGSKTNPSGPSSGSDRVGRGGSWRYDPQYCRVSYRVNYAPDSRYGVIGFRLARTM